MNLKKDLSRAVAPVAAAATVALTPGAPAEQKPEQLPEKNGVEQVVHATTNYADIGLGTAWTVATYPLQAAGNIVDAATLGVAKGVQVIGEHTGPVGRHVGGIVNAALGGANLVTQAAVKAGDVIAGETIKTAGGLVGSTLDSVATATRNPAEAVRRWGKESLLLSSTHAATTRLFSGLAATEGVFAAHNVVRTTLDGTAKIATAGVGAVHAETGAKLDRGVDIANGAGALDEFLSVNALSLGTMAATLGIISVNAVHPDMRQALVEHVESFDNFRAQSTQTDKLTEPSKENVKNNTGKPDPTLGEMIVDGLAELGQKAREEPVITGQKIGDELTKGFVAPVPEKTTRQEAKKIVQRSEEIRQGPRQTLREILLSHSHSFEKKPAGTAEKKVSPAALAQAKNQGR